MTDHDNLFSFNYIITVHNKEDLIEQVVLNVIACMGDRSKLYVVLDGCTDNSEKIVDSLAAQHPGKAIIKVFENDVHELKSINAGLRAASQEGDGINIILQDDVVLTDHDLESKVAKLYNFDKKLGIVSLRHAANISRRSLKKIEALVPLVNYTESIKGHNPNPFNMLKLGSFTYREVPMKSPICVPFYVVREAGMPDERFAPWDDLTYCYTVSRTGFNNGVFGVEFLSDLSWGTTRQKKQNNNILKVQTRNVNQFKEYYAKEAIAAKRRKIYSKKIYRIVKHDGRQQLPLKQAIKGTKNLLYKIMMTNLRLWFKK
jgi:glycosyltransferase involved in cell wall biosynthesis